MDASSAAQAVRDGKVVRVVTGEGPEDPVLLVFEEDGMAFQQSVAGWSAGITEPICGVESDFLEFHLRAAFLSLTDEKPNRRACLTD